MNKQPITVIAGGSKGLGHEITHLFQSAEHLVVDFSRSGEGNNHVPCDFADVDQAAELFHTTLDKIKNQEKYSEINLIINTAVLRPFGSLEKAAQKDIELHLNINVHSTMYLLQSFIQHFQHVAVKKTITYISSGAARRDIPGLAMYSASKAFFERFLDTTATEQERCKNPFDCLIINPGVMNTGMQTEIRSQSKEDFPMVDMWNELHMKGQLANPSDIAQVCFDLITDSGRNGGYYTAQDLMENRP